jgi:phosphoglycolate phosphatase
VPIAGIRAVGFDLDGTLIDTLPDLAVAINAMLGQLGHSPLAEDRIRTLVGDGAEPLVERALMAGRQAGTGDASMTEALAVFKALYSDQLFRKSRVYPGVLSTLRVLAGAGLALCCITNKDGALAQPLMQAAGLAHHLAFTLGPATPEERKPSPALLLRACTRLGVTPQQMLYVGDSATDMEAAHAAGCGAIAVSYGYDERIRNGAGNPDAVIASFSELDRLPAGAC